LRPNPQSTVAGGVMAWRGGGAACGGNSKRLISMDQAANFK